MSSDEQEEIVPPGTTLGRYRVVRRIGAGGMGAVYEAVHTGLNKRVAIKVLHPAIAKDPGVRARFLQEGEVAARIRHPNVVDVHDVATENGVTYLVMDYLEGEDLAAVIKREAPMAAPRIAELMLPVIDAIRAAHEAGVVHRDLKPSNVFLARAHGRVAPQVLDFGISKILQEQSAEPLTRTGMVMGTPNYMAPEQVLANKSLDGRADVYALGAIVYECATGRRAFVSGSMVEILVRIAQGNYPPPRTVHPGIDERLEHVITLAMMPDRDQRYPDAQTMAEALRSVAADTPEPEPTVVRPAVTASTPTQPPLDKGPRTLDDARPLTGIGGGPSRMGPVLGVVAAVVGAAIAFAVLREPPRVEPIAEPTPSQPAPTVATFAVSVAISPPTAIAKIDGAPIAHAGQLEARVAKDGKQHQLEVSAPGFATQTHPFFEDVPPPPRVELVPVGNNEAPIVR